MTIVDQYHEAAIAGTAIMEAIDISASVFWVAVICLVWWIFIILVQIIGSMQLFRHYSSTPASSVVAILSPDSVPHVTILRPVKGIEPQLYECLAATFLQSYPKEKLTVYFCVSSKSDPAYPILLGLLADFPQFDAKILVEEEDPNLSGNGETNNLGPNPKIRNMSRGYREAKGDIIWIIDCNIWVGKDAAGRMVDKLCGYEPNGKKTLPYKFVHLLPLVVDNVGSSVGEETRQLLGSDYNNHYVSSTSSAEYDVAQKPSDESKPAKSLRIGGGRLEEMFMASTHAKFYTAINTVAVAPCIVGKSNMFRKSHLDALTSTSSSYCPGIDFFSQNICEDHLIGDLLWRKSIPAEKNGEKWGKHALVFGNLAIQPMAGMSIREYVARRVRWLRVRKWTVTLATLIEPGVESLLCSAYGAFAFTTLPWFNQTLGIPRSWAAFGIIWLILVVIWASVDWMVYQRLQSGASIDLDSDTPSFARPPKDGRRRPFYEWISAWLGRELLALPVWSWAVLGGTTVVWRGKKFWVGMDMKVHEITAPSVRSPSTPEAENGSSHIKARTD